MNNARKALIGLFLAIIIVSTLAHTVLAQKNETKDILQQENKTTTAQNTAFSEVTQKSEVTKEDIIIEAQRSLDRSLSILNIVATLMGVLVGMFAFIVAIAAATGYFGLIREIKKVQEIKKNIEQDAEVIKRNIGTINELKSSAEKIVDSMRNELNKLPQPSLTEKPSNEIIGKLDEFSHRLELLEMLGVSLKPEDYINRGLDFYYKDKYELALKAFDKAIELKSDNYLAWFMKSSVLFLLRRCDEALKAIEKTIELKPENEGAWLIKGACFATGEIGQYDEALKAFDKAIELKPDNPIAWHGKGLIIKGRGRYDEALQAFETAIELKPDYVDAWYSRARVYSIKDGKEEALLSLKKAIGIDKSYKEKAKKDKDFENLWDDEDFKKLVG